MVLLQEQFDLSLHCLLRDVFLNDKESDQTAWLKGQSVPALKTPID